MLTIAHRGHSTGAPEQTMSAFATAASLGIDMIEADVRRTRDGALVLMHDETVDRTTSGSGRVAELDLAEVLRLDAGSWFSAHYAGETVPTLDAFFALAEETGVSLCLEAKGETAAEQQWIIDRLSTELRRRSRVDRDVVASFDHRALGLAVARTPELTVAPDRLPERGPSDPASVIEQARVSRARIVQYHQADLDAAMVEALHDAGIAVWAWPVTTDAEIGHAISTGVDGLMGDDAANLVRAARTATTNAATAVAALSTRGRA
jgi:glycerophosphoryl diester phosphodiesterase